MHNKSILNVYLGEAPKQQKKIQYDKKSDLINNVLNEQLTKSLRFTSQW